MYKQAKNLRTIEEFPLEDDRIFRSDDGWYYQVRGSAEAFGPFRTSDAAKNAWIEMWNEPCHHEWHRYGIVNGKPDIACQLCGITKAIVLLFALAMPASADIRRWDTGEVIPGTEGVTPGPGVNFKNMDLDIADLANMDLSGASFYATSLEKAKLDGSNLTGAGFTFANIHQSSMIGATLINADLTNLGVLDRVPVDFTDAVIHGAKLPVMSLQQIYSTASYKNKDLHGIDFTYAETNHADFSGQNLSGSVFQSNSTSACFIPGIGHKGLHNTNLSNADLTGVDFTGVCIEGAIFSGAKGYVPPGYERTPGDSNGDGRFDSSDLVQVFSAGLYEDDVTGNAGFDTGDWNSDGDFNSSDLVLAFSVGAYEVQAAPAAVAVPEPTGVSIWTLLWCVLGLVQLKKKWQE